MDIRIITNFPLSIKSQIKRQIRAMVRNGQLKNNTMLPSAKELGLFLNINRNTVAGVYKELEQEGILKIIKGSGTYIRKQAHFRDNDRLEIIFETAIRQARRAGFSSTQITDTCISCLLQNALQQAKNKKIILIDCNYEVLETLDAKIKAHYPAETHFMLIQDIQAMPGKFLKRAREYDLILCGMNHMSELTSAVPDLPAQTIGFLIRTDFHIMDRILQLPAGTTVGYCCISRKSARAFFSSTRFPSGSTLKRIHAGIDDVGAIQPMFDACDIIFATHYVYDMLLEKSRGSQKIHRVDLDIDAQNFEYILSILGKETSRGGQSSIANDKNMFRKKTAPGLPVQ